MFTGITVDVAPIISGLTDAIKIGLPVMISIVALQKGVGFLKGAIKGN